MSPTPPRGRTFEEFTPGETLTTPGRSITEADIRQFAALSGDHNPLHVDPSFARQGPYGRQIAHGLLGLAVTTGLFSQMGLLERTVLAFRELTWKFSLPIFIGDTLHATATVTACKPIPRMQTGAIDLSIAVLNQDGRSVQSGTWRVLVACRPNPPQP